MAVEYRICWDSRNNVSFQGATDWTLWTEDGDPEEVLNDAEKPDQPMNLPRGLEEALEGSGFQWSVETRDAGKSR